MLRQQDGFGEVRIDVDPSSSMFPALRNAGSMFKV